MYDKTVRRRRAVLALLVVLSLILLTAYFGESSERWPALGAARLPDGRLADPGGREQGAEAGARPVRLVRRHAARQRASSPNCASRTTNCARKLIAERADEHGYHELLALYHLDQLSLNELPPGHRDGRRQVAEPLVLDVWIDKGTSAGVRKNDPVINDEGLVGKVAQAASDGAEVDLITDSDVGVSARINGTNATGVVQPKVGEPNDLVLQYLPGGTPANRGEYVVTSGTVEQSGRLAVPAGDPDRAGQLGERRKRVQVGQRAPAGRPAQPRRRAGADVHARAASRRSCQPPVGSSAGLGQNSTTGSAKAAR